MFSGESHKLVEACEFVYNMQAVVKQPWKPRDDYLLFLKRLIALASSLFLSSYLAHGRLQRKIKNSFTQLLHPLSVFSRIRIGVQLFMYNFDILGALTMSKWYMDFVVCVV